MTDEEFAFEVLEHQVARWGKTGLAEHYVRHAGDVERLLGRRLTETEYSALSDEIRLRPDRVYTRLTENMDVEYDFARSVESRRAILLMVTRRGLVRTLFPTPIQRWLKRYPEAVEVTDRVKGIESSD